MEIARFEMKSRVTGQDGLNNIVEQHKPTGQYIQIAVFKQSVCGLQVCGVNVGKRNSFAPLKAALSNRLFLVNFVQLTL